MVDQALTGRTTQGLGRTRVYKITCSPLHPSRLPATTIARVPILPLTLALDLMLNPSPTPTPTLTPAQCKSRSWAQPSPVSDLNPDAILLSPSTRSAAFACHFWICNSPDAARRRQIVLAVASRQSTGFYQNYRVATQYPCFVRGLPSLSNFFLLYTSVIIMVITNSIGIRNAEKISLASP